MQINIRTLLLAATAALLATLPRVEAATITYGHNSTLAGTAPVNPGFLIVNKITVTEGGNLISLGVLTPSAGSNANLALYKADGAGGEPGTLVAQSGSFALAAGTNEHPATTPVRVAPGDYWVGGVSDGQFPIYVDFFGDAYVSSTPGPIGTLPPAWTGTVDSGIASVSFYITVATSVTLYKKGDAVPGVTGKTFTSFGIPAVNEAGQVAFLGKWSGGVGIFADGALVSKVGDVLTGTTAIKSLKDPVIDDAGYVAFACKLTGGGISGTNDSAIVSNAPGGTLAIVAQEGTQAADAPAGALWKSFTSTAAPGGGGGVIILGFMAQGAGGITATNDNGVWSADSSGVLHLVLQEGTTVLNGNTVKNFAVLKAVSGSPGQTHAHNTIGELVSKVTFADGSQAVVKQFLP